MRHTFPNLTKEDGDNTLGSDEIRYILSCNRQWIDDSMNASYLDELRHYAYAHATYRDKATMEYSESRPWGACAELTLLARTFFWNNINLRGYIPILDSLERGVRQRSGCGTLRSNQAFKLYHTAAILHRYLDGDKDGKDFTITRDPFEVSGCTVVSKASDDFEAAYTAIMSDRLSLGYMNIFAPSITLKPIAERAGCALQKKIKQNKQSHHLTNGLDALLTRAPTPTPAMQSAAAQNKAQ